MRREEAKAKWTDQQILFINQLHLFTVMTLTGKVALVEKDGDKQVIVQEGNRRRPGPARTRSARGAGADHGLRQHQPCPTPAVPAAAQQAPPTQPVPASQKAPASPKK